jgi:CRISPR-associated endonuclease/helicase Cas3
MLFEELQKTYFAHLSHDKKEKETLFEHSKLVSDYCLMLIDAHGIEIIIDSLIKKLNQNMPIENHKEFESLFKESFLAAIIYHDLGKVNPNFQVLRMENELFLQEKNLSIQSYHSFLGSYLYVNVLLKRIFENEKFNIEEKLLSYFIVLLFSSAIVKHHNSTIDLSFEFDEQQVDDCFLFLKTYCIKFDKGFGKNFFLSAVKIFEGFTKLVEDKLGVHFALFSTTKLLYSLLTASDFYATNEFMTKIEVTEFGILSKPEKEKLIERFKTVKPYNKDLYAKLEHYQSIPFEKLTERNNQNLNILRQKLTAEMISNLREHSANRCFYLEAPTGAGKTNLSLAFATELMNVDSS